MPSKNTLQDALILVIDDDQVTRLMLRTVLTKSGFRVIDAENGKQGFSAFIEQRPSLVLMDVMMPEMNGYDATKAIRNYEQDQNIPILMLTSLDDVESVDHAFNAGATDFITKPINWSLLSQRVRYALKSYETEARLRTSQAQLLYAQKIAKLGYWEWDAEKDQVSASSSAFELFGTPKADYVSLEQFLSHVIPKDRSIIHHAISEASINNSDLQISFRVLRPNQVVIHIDCLGEVTHDAEGTIVKITGSAQDISRLHKAEMLIDYQANHDKLTDLANRTYFNRTLSNYLDEADSKLLHAVIVFDINRFKVFNDNLGSANGDKLLYSVASRLKRITRENDFVARLGSDEFAILLKRGKDISAITSSILRIIDDLKQPYMVNGQETFINFSFGASLLDNKTNTADQLIAHANIARNQAKQKGSEKFLFYQAEMNNQAKEQLTLENDLRKALINNEIEVYFQPQVFGDTLQIYGAEALVRWNHTSLGIISPAVFIPMAESTGLIVDIGQFVIETAVKSLEKWEKMGYQNLHIGINVSAKQFSHSDLMKDIQQVLTQTDIRPKQLDLEITESLAMADADHNISVINGLKALGVSISIDDFGTGYSSLAYLHSFPIDTIKIDRSFVSNMDTPKGQAIINTILAMANSLNLDVVAEGIEEDFQAQLLQEKHCDIFQGYKFGKPMAIADFEDYLAQHYTPRTT